MRGKFILCRLIKKNLFGMKFISIMVVVSLIYVISSVYICIWEMDEKEMYVSLLFFIIILIGHSPIYSIFVLECRIILGWTWTQIGRLIAEPIIHQVRQREINRIISRANVNENVLPLCLREWFLLKCLLNGHWLILITKINHMNWNESVFSKIESFF